jgi:mono/diheme cytochrome c family protein
MDCQTGREVKLSQFTLALSLGLVSHTVESRALLCPSSEDQSAPGAAASATQLVGEYCVACHSARGKAGGLELAGFDAARADANIEVSEKMIRKLRAGMMPPPGTPRPDAATMRSLVETLETKLDQAAAKTANPGWRPFPRLNRAQYARAVRDLLGMQIDVSKFLPADTLSNGFDNVADVQSFSPTLITGYLRGASQISRLAAADGASTLFSCRPRNAKQEPALSRNS